ncbi:MAG: hypothetical protein ACRDTS_22475 [Mycobacterium sp.]
MRLRLMCARVVALAMATAATTAFAAGPSAGTCTGTASSPGAVDTGTYNGFTVTGTCFFVPGADITINGNLTIAQGASLNAHDLTAANVQVNGNVNVNKGGTVGLGDYYYGSPPYPGPTVVVNGNVVANQPQSLYLSFITVHGSILSNGGSGPGLNFPIKNVTVDGNVDLQGWSGGWIGLFRSTIGGNVNFSNNTGAGESGPDSSEVANNTVGGNLICHGNDPLAQFGDSGGGPNVVSGQALGECATLTEAP